MASVRASEKGLKIIEQARRQRGWTKTRTEYWWISADISQSTLRRFWARQPIRQENFEAICRAVQVEQWQDIVDQRFTEDDERIAGSCLTAHEATDALAQSAIISELPEGVVELNSPFYIERSPLEGRCYETMTHPGALIRIKAPRQMGKTSLLERICNQAEQKSYLTVRLNLSQADASILCSLDKFLRWFCTYISHKLKLKVPPKDYWDPDRGSIVNCTTYFQEQILELINRPLILALDEVDRVFQSSSIVQGFFSMLRSWHEEAKTTEAWEQLRLVIAHSTEDYGPLDINLSPFNVGLPIELVEFTVEQIQTLAKRHKLDWQADLIPQLMGLVGGHPYLIRLAMFHLAWQDLTLSQLLQEATTDTGIYATHLRRHLKTLREHPELALALQRVITAQESIRLETMQAYRLYSMGLVKRNGNHAQVRCQLYRSYFCERLEA